MPRSAQKPLYLGLIAALREARRKARLTQTDVAKRLKRPQSFVAKYEGGERRLDIGEFVEVAEAVGADPTRLFTKAYLSKK